MIAVNLSKQQELDTDSKAIQRINFTENLEEDENTTMFFIIKEANFEYLRRNCESTVTFIISV